MTRLVGFVTALIALAIITTPSRAAIISFTTTLSGPAESPPNASPGTGVAQVDYDTIAHTLRVNVTFSGLTVGNTAAHIHSATPTPLTGVAGVATTVPTFAGFPTGATSGAYDNTLDLTLASSFNPAFVTANGGTLASTEAALVNGLVSSRAYLNIHTSNFPQGEIRGFLVPTATPQSTAVPEPSTFVLFGMAAALGAGCYFYRRQRALTPIA